MTFAQRNARNNASYNAQSQKMDTPLIFGAPEGNQSQTDMTSPEGAATAEAQQFKDYQDRFKLDTGVAEKMRGMGYMPGMSAFNMDPKLRRYLPDSVQTGESATIQAQYPDLAPVIQQNHQRFYPQAQSFTGKYVSGVPQVATNSASSTPVTARQAQPGMPAPVWNGVDTYNPQKPEVGQIRTAANGTKTTVTGIRPAPGPFAPKQRQMVSYGSPAPAKPKPYAPVFRK
jgi:hypothetical protein